MVLDVSSLPEDEDEDETADELTVDLDKCRRKKGLGRLHISHLLQMVLQDAQTRLTFKAQSVIQSDIRYYAPKQEDLAYPDILICAWHSLQGHLTLKIDLVSACVAARKPTSGMEIREKESVSQIFHLPSLDKQDTWYPTLRKTVWVLSQLHDFVKVHDPLALQLSLTEYISKASNIRGHRAGDSKPMPTVTYCSWRHAQDAESTHKPSGRTVISCAASAYP